MMVSIEDVTDIDDYFPFDTYRDHQKDILLKSIQDLKDGKDVVIIEGPTGFGKSAVNIALANYFGDAFYTSPQVKLVEQLTDDFGPNDLVIDGGDGDIIPLLGRKNYTCRETEEESDICDIYLRDGESCSEQDKCTYNEQKKAAHQADTILLTFAKLVTDTISGESLGDRDLVIVDEAHSLENQTASLFCGFAVSPANLPMPIWEKVEKRIPQSEDFEDFESWLWTVEDECQRYQSNGGATKTEIRQIKKMKRSLEYLKYEISEDRKWVVNLDEISQGNDKYERPEFKPVWVSRFLRRMIWDRGEQVVLSTATVPFRDKPRRWLRRIGLGDAEYSLHTVPMTFPVENRPIITSTMNGKMTRRKEEDNWDENLATVKKILDNHESENGVIHTQSYDRAERLAQELNGYSTFLHPSDLDGNIIDEWRDSDDDVLISPAVREGVDLKGDLCRFQILFKVPYPSLADNRVSYLLNEKGHWNWYRQEAAKYVIQMYGRAVRSSEDHANFYVIDGSFYDLINKASSSFPEWFAKAMKYGEEEYDDFADKRKGYDYTPYSKWELAEGELSIERMQELMEKNER